MSAEQIAVAVAHSKFKIEWAENHIKSVKEIVKVLTSQDGYILKPEQDLQTGNYRLYIGPKEGIPVSLPMHIGDAVHSLNSVMDYLWSGLARSVAPELVSKITFPRDETKQNLMARLSNPSGINATIERAFPQARSFILDTIKPYNGTDDRTGSGSLIWSLNKFDNINKHRLLIPTTSIIAFKRDLVIRATDGATFVQRAGTLIKTLGPNLTICFSAPFEFNDDSDPTIDIVFDERDRFGGEPVSETLDNLVKAVREVVYAFEKTFVG